MQKFEYVDEAKKVCVVVLKDHWGDTVAKGMARCSDDDTFNKDAGLKLANARAWNKYFDVAIKDCKRYINGDKSCIASWERDLAKEEKNLEILNSKKADLEKETEELLSSL
jgi:hypothetical protein